MVGNLTEKVNRDSTQAQASFSKPSFSKYKFKRYAIPTCECLLKLPFQAPIEACFSNILHTYWSFSLFGDLIFLDMVFVFNTRSELYFYFFCTEFFIGKRNLLFFLRYSQEIMLGKKNPIHAKHLRKMYHSDFLSVEKEDEKKKLSPVNMLDPLICELIRSIFRMYVISFMPKTKFNSAASFLWHYLSNLLQIKFQWNPSFHVFCSIIPVLFAFWRIILSNEWL